MRVRIPWRLPLMLPIGLLEVLVLAMTMLIFFVRPNAADRIARWALRIFPSNEWYFR